MKYLGVIFVPAMVFCSSTALRAEGNNEPGMPMLSHPASAGSAVRGEATVAFVSDGYSMGNCKVIKPTGNNEAERQACSTAPFFKTRKPLYAVTSYWTPPSYLGHFIYPKSRTKRPPVGAGGYPNWSLRNNEQGTSTIRATIGLNGRVKDCQIAQSSGYSTLDKASCKQFTKNARYRPATLDGKPIVSVLFTTIAWGLGNGPQPEAYRLDNDDQS